MPSLSNQKRPSRNAPIDWDQFMDGRQRTCKQGKDFEGPAEKFQHRARHAAKRRGMRATTWTVGRDVVVEFRSLDSWPSSVRSSFHVEARES